MRAEPVHERGKAGKARLDRARIVDRGGMLGGSAKDEEGHRDAMVEPRFDRGAAARRASLALDDERLAVDLHLGAAGGEPLGDGAEPVALLDAELRKPAH